MVHTLLPLFGLLISIHLSLVACTGPRISRGDVDERNRTEQARAFKPDSTEVKILGHDPDNCTWVESRASVSFGDQDTKHQALAQAVSEARAKAMHRLLGVRLQHHFIDFQLESSLKGEVGLTEHLLRVTRLGRELKENILWAGFINLSGCDACLFEAHIQTCIAPLRDMSDKDFRVNVSLNQTRFNDGDEARITVTSSRDAHLYIYNVDMDWNATLIFPNDYAKDNRVSAGQAFSYPGEELRARGIQGAARLLPGSKVSAEMIRVIASKAPLPMSLLDPSEVDSQERNARGSSEVHGAGSFLSLLRKLNAADVEWVEDAQVFTIHKR